MPAFLCGPLLTQEEGVSEERSASQVHRNSHGRAPTCGSGSLEKPPACHSVLLHYGLGRTKRNCGGKLSGCFGVCQNIDHVRAAAISCTMGAFLVLGQLSSYYYYNECMGFICEGSLPHFRRLLRGSGTKPCCRMI